MEQIIEKYHSLESKEEVLDFLKYPQEQTCVCSNAQRIGHCYVHPTIGQPDIDLSRNFYIREALLECENPPFDFDKEFIDELCEAFPHVKEIFE